ncbi:MAG: hypothetical protein GX638_01900 [Crenarchaeota archaeon]|nr:hypothetical protein [Thermoproteota archaeon]
MHEVIVPMQNQNNHCILLVDYLSKMSYDELFIFEEKIIDSNLNKYAKNVKQPKKILTEVITNESIVFTKKELKRFKICSNYANPDSNLLFSICFKVNNEHKKNNCKNLVKFFNINLSTQMSKQNLIPNYVY